MGFVAMSDTQCERETSAIACTRSMSELNLLMFRTISCVFSILIISFSGDE